MRAAPIRSGRSSATEMGFSSTIAIVSRARDHAGVTLIKDDVRLRIRVRASVCSMRSEEGASWRVELDRGEW